MNSSSQQKLVTAWFVTARLEPFLVQLSVEPSSKASGQLISQATKLKEQGQHLKYDQVFTQAIHLIQVEKQLNYQQRQLPQS